MSATVGGSSAQTGGAGPEGLTSPVARLGLTSGMVVQELGWDDDTDDGHATEKAEG